jgi:hypothetical protein
MSSARLLVWAGLLCGIIVTSARAEEKNEAAAIIDKAIKATGGADKLAKAKAVTWKEKGTYYGQGNGLAYTGNYASQGADQWRMEIVDVFTMVVNGDKGWTKTANGTEDMTKEQLAETKEGAYSGWITSLVPLKEKEFKLSLLGEIKVDDKPAVGVRVSSKGHRDVNLYFDKDRGLLVKSSMQVKSQENEGKEMSQEVFYTDYKELDGIKVPHKVVVKRDGKDYVVAETIEMKRSEKLDASVFAKP